MAEPLSDRARDVLHAIIREYISTGGPVGSQQLARSSGFERLLGHASQRHGGPGGARVPREAAYLGRPHSHRPCLPLLRRHPDSAPRPEPPGPRLHPAGHPQRDPPRGLAPGGRADPPLPDPPRRCRGRPRGPPRGPSTASSSSASARAGCWRSWSTRTARCTTVRWRWTSRSPRTSWCGRPTTSASCWNDSPWSRCAAASSRSWPSDQAAYDQLVAKALKLGLLATGVPPTEKVFIEGTGSFLDAPEFADVERMRSLFRALEEKTRLMALLERVHRAREMQIFIGHESDLSPGGEVTLVATPYGPADRSLGTVGVIGPTRMNYQRVIPLVAVHRPGPLGVPGSPSETAALDASLPGRPGRWLPAAPLRLHAGDGLRHLPRHPDRSLHRVRGDRWRSSRGALRRLAPVHRRRRWPSWAATSSGITSWPAGTA